MNYRCSECGKRFKTVEGTLLHKLKSHANELPSLRKGNQRRRAARNREEQGQDSRGAGEREEGRMAKRKAAQKAYGYNCPVCGDPIMGSRLWRVTVERTMMVVAADEREAEREAEYYAKEEDSLADMVAASLVSRVEDIPQEWRDSIPWGGDRKDDRTCAERVESATDPNSATPRERASDARKETL